ncbi:molybdopterin molybdotransferase MoeA [Paraclostridium bifermentans]|uniref:Molybdopterin molybdenumtransferase n=1 Tax=Paraclostridium bifermentans TaxID=1490 RepID=A0AA44IH05_PARBF|nr:MULTISPECIES: molybdopterin molybdotransferase MoeA [Paraclostridium]MBN8046622.1 molybdopterin molybdotransferase MoeA [Paraclostridium bifermentans]MBZ6004836.1 molybdopterin molybdotransferase MoeA [Paraclostridium bifermentans]MDU0296109.1 molybdopterin molybdotransferase MoeA [Paraclostridium sp. MRS3W1]NME09309.1 molybdopterin molybdotransferase MoeA [Paraclostridium bifermentans]
MDFFNVMSVDEVKKILSNNFKNMKIETEIVNIFECEGRVLSNDIVSKFNVPEFNRSTVDGYAIKSKESHGCSECMPTFLDIVGEVSMGESASGDIKSGECMYVPTGGMIPNSSDAVIMIEHAEKLDEFTIAIHKPTSTGENVVYKGDDIKKDQIVIKKGKKLNSQDIGVLAALGVNEIEVYRTIKFTVISTGDEIIDLDEDLEFGKIRDINGYAIYSLIKKLGGVVVKKSIVKDDYNLLREEVQFGIDNSDIVLLSGGSSVGTRDFTHDVINSFNGQGVLVHGVALKPGKPTIIGECENKVVIGLPGHPVSAIIVFKIFIEYLVNEILEINENKYLIDAIINQNLHSSPGKKTYQMVSLEEIDNKYYATPIFGKSSMITLLSKACGYVIINENCEGLYKKEKVKVHLL